MDKRGFYFKTNKNEYFYDDITGRVFFEKNDGSNQILYGNNEYKKVSIDEKEIKEYIMNMETVQLTLIVTEECNMRCKYCMFSGVYDNARIHSDNYMSVDIARKAVKNYLEKAYQYRRKNLLFTPTIGFFGGEPLLNFSVIKDSVEYSRNIYNGKINYTITTNGILLDEEKINFFVKNNFFLVISLNGDKSENDRLRVYKNNIGTFEYVIKNIKMIANQYPEYFNRQVKISAVFDNGTDMFKLKDFFENDNLLNNKLAILSKVESTNTNWYDRYTDKENNKFDLQIKKLKEDFMYKLYNNEKIDIFSKKLFSIPYFNILNRCLNIEIKDVKPHIQPFSGACIPSTKISVDYRGLFHMCEKINFKIPYGDVFTGIDYTKLTSIINNYNNFLGKHCVNCPIQRICQVCYIYLINSNGEFEFNDKNFCETLINNQIKLFREIYYLLESGISSNDLKKLLV